MMTSYETEGIREYKDFHLPLVYRHDLFLAEFQPNLCQFLFLEQGELIVKEQERSLQFTAPLAMLINDKNELKGFSGRADRCHNIIFTPDALNTNYYHKEEWSLESYFFFLAPFHNLPARGYGCRVLPPEYNLKFSGLFRKLDLYLNRQNIPKVWPCLSRSYLLEILVLIERSHYLSEEHRELSIPETGTKMDDILMYVHTHYNEKTTLQELCARFATNRTTLNKLFRETCGMSAINYLNHIRLEIALSLLVNTLLPVQEIADRIGMEDISYFARAVKKKTGRSPSAFRKAVPEPYSVSH
jgi:AraC-like DNA-binding protein